MPDLRDLLPPPPWKWPLLLRSRTCGGKVRPLFEKAAVLHFIGTGEEAGSADSIAGAALYDCLGLPYSWMSFLFSEIERWFSFYSLWYSVLLIRQGNVQEALRVLSDQEETYSQVHARTLGIVADYGLRETQRLHLLTKTALDALKGNSLDDAIRYASMAADLQYNLAVERAGMPAPMPTR